MSLGQPNRDAPPPQTPASAGGSQRARRVSNSVDISTPKGGGGGGGGANGGGGGGGGGGDDTPSSFATPSNGRRAGGNAKSALAAMALAAADRAGNGIELDFEPPEPATPAPPPSRRSIATSGGGESRQATAAALAAVAAAAAAEERAAEAVAKGLVVARSKLKLRQGAALDTTEAGDLPAGATVKVVDTTALTDGTKRVCVCTHGERVPRGWVTAIDRKDGADNLLKPNDPAAMALVAHFEATAHRIPRLALGGSGRDGAGWRSPGRDRAGTDSQVFVVRLPLKMRSAADLESPECGSLAANAQVRILDRRELSDGTRRARIGSNDDEFTPLGWVSLLGKDGKENLVVEWRK
jgi:hypothetical protein